MKKIQFLFPAFAVVIALGGALVSHSVKGSMLATQYFNSSNCVLCTTDDSDTRCSTTVDDLICQCIASGIAKDARNSSCALLYKPD